MRARLLDCWDLTKKEKKCRGRTVALSHPKWDGMHSDRVLLSSPYPQPLLWWWHAY